MTYKTSYYRILNEGNENILKYNNKVENISPYHIILITYTQRLDLCLNSSFEVSTFIL